MRGERLRRLGIVLAVLAIAGAAFVVPAPAAPVTITVPYSALPVADAHLDGDPGTGDWSGAQSWVIPLENGPPAPYESATLVAKHDGTYVFFRVDGTSDVPWASAAGSHFWFGIFLGTTVSSHHNGNQDGVFFGEDAYTTAPPLVAVDTYGDGQPPPTDPAQSLLGEMRATGIAAPYAFTAEWKRRLNTGDANDVQFLADASTAYYFYPTTDSNGGGSGGGTISHRRATNDNIMRFATVPAPDSTPPVATLTTPADAAYVRQTVSVTATATDNVGVVSVTFLLDGNPLSVDTAAPYAHSWDTTAAPDGAHTVRADARDAAGNVGSDSVGVTVDNTAPTANAGADQAVTPGTLVTFDGTSSSDAIGIASHAWTFTDGGPQSLSGATPSYTFSNAGTFVVTLTVTDRAGNTAADTMTVTVALDLAPPVARAGADQSVLQGTLVSLDGSASTDDVGIDNYTWSFTDSTAVTLYGAVVEHRFLSVGNQAVTLTVRDVASKTATDTMWVNVTADAIPPVADAGPGRRIDLGQQVALDGSASSDNVAVAIFTWTFVDGSPQTLSGSSVAYTFTTVGNATVTLTVTDYAGNFDSGLTWVDVVADVLPPVANAGADVTIALGDTVTLDGSGSSDNVGVVNFTWVVQETSEVLYGSPVGYEPAAGGTLTVELTVSDAAGNTATDVLLVTVVAPDTTPPATPTGLTAAAADPGAVVLSWSPNGEPDLAGYLVFRLNADGNPVQLNAVPMTGTTYADAGLEPGRTYRYVIVAVDDSGNASPRATAVTASRC